MAATDNNLTGQEYTAHSILYILDFSLGDRVSVRGWKL